jgi:hypothetical protein
MKEKQSGSRSDESLLAQQNPKFIKEKLSHLVIAIVVGTSRTAILGLWCGCGGLSRESTSDLEVVLVLSMFHSKLM